MSHTDRVRHASSPQATRPLDGTSRAVWHLSAPLNARRAYASGDRSAGWVAWKRHLARRAEPSEPADVLPGGMDALNWGLPEGLCACPVPAWIDRAERLPAAAAPGDVGLEKDVFRWLGESAAAAVEPLGALETLSCAYVLPRFASVLSPEAWWAVLDHLLTTVADADAVALEKHPLIRQLLAGELALALAYLLPEIGPCRSLKSPARRAVSEGLIDLLDGEGVLHAQHFASWRPLLACWTRCRALGTQLRGGEITAPAREQYEWLVRQTLRTARHDGTHAMTNGATARSDAGLLAAALRLDKDDDDRQIAASVLPWGRGLDKKLAAEADLPEAAIHSEWAATAVLRPRWSRSGERLTVVYPGREVRMELACGKDVLWSGRWELHVRRDGHRLMPVSDWEQVCWVCDEDIDYLELEIELSGGLRVQRQMALAREDHFLLLADAVLGGTRGSEAGEGAGEIEYRGCLPLCQGVSFRQADETCEGFLAGVKRRALVLPLALPEWQSALETGRLARTATGLELRQRGGCNLYAPLFFDLDRRRQTGPLTWRQLTVAQSLAIRPPEIAVGYRVAVGRRQWLVYRSLAEKANRTLLGHNLSTEMLIARFDRSGEVEPLIEIE